MGGRSPLLRGYTWPVVPIFKLVRAISVISLVWKFGSDWSHLSRVIVSTDKKKKKKNWIFWEQKSPIRGGGLHLTFDAHFRTRMSYSSQKSCVKIWLGLVEIRGRLCKISVGGEPPIKGGGHMWPDMPIFLHVWAILVKCLLWKFGSD